MQFKTSTLIIGVFIALVVSFGSGWLLGRFDRNDTSDTIINGLNQVMRTYSYQINGLQNQAHQKDAVISEQRQTVKENLTLKEDLRLLKAKRVKDVKNLTNTIDILSDSIKYIQAHMTVITPCPPGDNNPVLYLPLSFKETVDGYVVTGVFDEQGQLTLEVKLIH